MISVRDAVDRKRRGERLTRDELAAIVLGYTRGETPDYQVAAWLMAVCFQGMSADETAELTELLADSGERLDLSTVGPVVGDKHSTGGVGDKTSLVALPLASACGLPIAKMSGRGLGFSGGTIDKLESIDGLRVELEPGAFVEQVRRVGLAIVGQSARLAPADGKLYALRDVTATVEQLGLIASSVMSKKLAAGANVIVLDVKTGRGAFMQDLRSAVELAELMVAIGRAAGRKVAALVSDMSQPLGQAVGNALEIAEVVESLRNGGPGDLAHLAESVAAELLLLAGLASNRDNGLARAARARQDGSGLARFRQMVEAQGGDPRQVDDPGRLPQAPVRQSLAAWADGYVAREDARLIARAANLLGAGREHKGDPIDPAAGIVVHAKPGERVSVGQPLATLYGRDDERLAAARQLVQQAFQLDPAGAVLPPLIHERIGG